MQLLLLECFLSDTWKGKSQRFSDQLLNFAQYHLLTFDRVGRYRELKLNHSLSHNCSLSTHSKYEITCLNLAHSGGIFGVIALTLYLLQNKTYTWTGVVHVRCCVRACKAMDRQHVPDLTLPFEDFVSLRLHTTFDAVVTTAVALLVKGFL